MVYQNKGSSIRLILLQLFVKNYKLFNIPYLNAFRQGN